MTARHWYTLREAAEVLGLSYEATRDRYREGRFRSTRLHPSRRGRPTVLVADCCVRAERACEPCECPSAPRPVPSGSA